MYNILVVDDAIFMRNIIKKILENHRYKVVAEASTGREAVRWFKSLKPNLVIMDIIMPDLDGIDAVKEIVEHDPSALVIMCSAWGNKDVVIRAIVGGAKGFIVKPFDKDLIIKTVSGLIGIPTEGGDDDSKPATSQESSSYSQPAAAQSEIVNTYESITPSGDDDDDDDRNMSSLEKRLRRELKEDAIASLHDE